MKPVIAFENLIVLRVSATQMAIQSKNDPGRGHLVTHNAHQALSCTCQAHQYRKDVVCTAMLKCLEVLKEDEKKQEAAVREAQSLLTLDTAVGKGNLNPQGFSFLR